MMWLLLLFIVVVVEAPIAKVLGDGITAAADVVVVVVVVVAAFADLDASTPATDNKALEKES